MSIATTSVELSTKIRQAPSAQLDVFDSFIRRHIKSGSLTLVHPDRRHARYGDGSGPELVVELGPGVAMRLMLAPSMALGECYMEGGIRLTTGSIHDLVKLIGLNFQDTRTPAPIALLQSLWSEVQRRWYHINDRKSSRLNVAHHYDISPEFYKMFLDTDLQYSCGYFDTPDVSLEDAQEAKKAHITAKLRVEPGHRVLDIGCGWGGLALSLGAIPDVSVVGLTLSEEQLAVARTRAADKGMSRRVSFELQDYRDISGPFDRVVSVGMFEHVGRPNYQAYFDKIAQVLTDDGVAVVHSIGRRTAPGLTDPWISKYIFPGGYIPSLSEVLPYIERAGLWVTDLEILRLHYAETLRNWRARFVAVRDEVAAMFDERFCRMWEYYLAASEAAFQYYGHMNFQIQLSKKVGSLPITRGYMVEDEKRYMAAGSVVQFVKND